MAGRKKGLSADEKRLRILELFYESKEFYQMKELEKIAQKQKGVISQSVKEVTELLVSEGLVEREKIGTFVCYWAFPTKAAQTRKRKLDDLNVKCAEMEAKMKDADATIAEAQQGKQDDEERKRLKEELLSSTTEADVLRRELQALQRFDPSHMAAMKQRTKDAVESAN